MSLPKQRVTLITLAVSDMARARRFYEGWGWVLHPAAQAGLGLYQLQGQALALFDIKAMAEDQGRPGTALGTGAMTLAQNFADRAAVDSAFAAALSSGATALKPPKEVFWGGYSGYVADPDGHVWELAHNPFWPLAEDGSLTLPAAGG